MAVPRNEADLERALRFLYQQWKLLGYRPISFYRMFDRHCDEYKGGVAAVQFALRKRRASGFEFLRSRSKLGFSIERLVLRENWTHLFTEDDRRIAKARLLEVQGSPLPKWRTR